VKRVSGAAAPRVALLAALAEQMTTAAPRWVRWVHPTGNGALGERTACEVGSRAGSGQRYPSQGAALRCAEMPYLAEKIREQAQREITPEALEQLLLTCPSLLVLDGLDEVPTSSDRDRMLSAAHALLQRLERAGARGIVVATTRPQGYAGDLADLGLLLRTLHLVPLSKERALAYAEKLAETRFAEPPERTKKVLERLRLAAEEEATARLMQSPLQVTIMATLVDRIGRAPSERWNLFRDYYRVIYEREIERTLEGPVSAAVRVALNEVAELLRTYRFRWTMPASWARRRPRVIWSRSRSTFGKDRRPQRSSRWWSPSPWRGSITM